MNARSGLDGVIAAETTLSHVDGEGGRLIVRGIELRDLVAARGFEGVAALLWEGLGEGGGDADAVRAGLAAARERAAALVPAMLADAGHLAPIELLRLGLARLGDGEPMPHHYLLCGAAPVLVAAIARGAAVAPDPALGTAADLLRMLRGHRAGAVEEKALDTYLATVADHGFNASTFTARVVASTKAGMISAALAALSALKGPLHGGAPGPVLDMLDAIGAPANVGPWLEAALASGARLMGFGHRVYKVRDPRADVLKATVETLPVDQGRLAFAGEVAARAVETLARSKPGRRLDMNVEFYTALLLEALGIPRAVFTGTFAVGRMAGWCAHVMEQERDGRLIRPLSAYVGPEVKRAA
ncbi:citrate synthase [Desertibaculum subflavum]|uniref:citrate synthase n=1 Tax=Desertibaculum subflavum TaxID=2268458 RepID=UPI000E66AF69